MKNLLRIIGAFMLVLAWPYLSQGNEEHKPVPPNLTNWLVSPNGGETYALGSTINLTIDGALYTPPTVAIELYKGVTRVWGPSHAGVSGRTISTSGLSPGSDYRVRIFNASVPSEEDWSNSYFTIGSAGLSNWLTSPNGGQVYAMGATIPVTVNTSVLNPGVLTLEVYKGTTRIFGPSTGGVTGRTITVTSSYSIGSDYRVRVYNSNNPTQEDYSNAYFSIGTAPALTNWLQSPNGEEVFSEGSTISLTINSILFNPSTTAVELYKGSTRVYGPNMSGTSGRTIPTSGLAAGSDYRVRIYNASNTAEGDWSNGYFAIGSLSSWLQSPNSGNFILGTSIPLTISTSVYNPAAISVELYKGSSRVWGPSIAGASGRTIPTSGLAAGTDYRVRIFNTNSTTREDWSDSFISLNTLPTNWLQSPNGGGSYPVGASIPITINTSAYSPGGLGIELYKGSTRVWGPSISGNTGRTIPTSGLAAGSDYRVRVYDANNASLEDWSDANFSLVTLGNWLQSPNGEEVFSIGSAINLAIDQALFSPSAVTVEFWKGSTMVSGPSTGGITSRTISTTGLSPGTDYRVRIYNASNSVEEDWSNGNITLGSLASWLTSPNSGSFVIGQTISLGIDASIYAPASVSVELYNGSTRVYGPVSGGVSGRSIPTSGLTAGTDYKIRIFNTNNGAYEDWSTPFAINNLTNWLTSPNGGEKVVIGSTINLTINTSVFSPGGVAVALYKGSTMVWGPSFSGATGRTIPTSGLTPGTDYRVKIYDANNAVYEDWSNGDFSLITLENWLQSPNGEEFFTVGPDIPLTINAAHFNPGAVTVELYKGTTRVNGPSTGGATSRTVPTTGLTPGTDYKIKIFNASTPVESDWSDASFAVGALTNWLTSPNGGSFIIGQTISLAIDANVYAPASVSIELYNGTVKVYGPISGGTTGRTIPTTGLTPGTNYKVRIFNTNKPTIEDWSDPFTLNNLDAWLTSPNGGQKFVIGSSIPVTLNTLLYNPGGLSIELYKGTTRVAGPYIAGTTGRTIPTTGLAAGTDYKIKIIDANNASYSDMSDAAFSLITLDNWLTVPNGEEVYSPGSMINLTINTAHYNPSPITVELYKGATRVWGPSTGGSTSRTIPTAGLASGTDYKVKIINAIVPSESDMSDGFFTVTSQMASWLSAPNAGNFAIGMPIPVTLNTAIYAPASVSIELYKGATKVYGPVVSGSGHSIPTTGLTPGNDYRVRVFNTAKPGNEDWSDGSITLNTLTSWLTSPNGGESFTVGEAISVNINGTIYSPVNVGVQLYKGATVVFTSTTGGVIGRTIPTATLAAGTDYRVRIYDVAAPSYEDYSDVAFSIMPTHRPKRLYNGIIAGAQWRTDKAYQVAGEDLAGVYTYQYDHKYQLREAHWVNPQNILEATDKFKVTDLRYDPNGNLLSLSRFDGNAVRIHQFTYNYNTGGPSVQQTNKLEAVPGYATYTYNQRGHLIGEDKASGDDQYIDYDINGNVRAVYSVATKTEVSKTVEYLYDDRGFRLAKIDFRSIPKMTTWYIRDAAGNLTGIYEQEGVAAATNAMATIQKELPVYGAGKIATYYPDPQFPDKGSTNYEIADHLGNVRAILRDNLEVYQATMEDNDQPDITNPRVAEMVYFENIFETEETNTFLNISKPVPSVPSPGNVANLYWNDTQGTQASDRAVGPSVALAVKKGDRVNIETWAHFEYKTSFAKDFQMAMLSSLLGNTFIAFPGFDGMSPAAASGNILGALTAAAYQSDDVGNTSPYAYVNYILYDENMAMVDAGWKRVPEAAGSHQTVKPIRLAIDEAIAINQPGYIYVWVSNQSKLATVRFDDLTVVHAQPIVTQASDYGAWGDVIREQKTDPSVFYRHGYQSMFAEKDRITGWHHFKRREYDATIGRWLATDPAKQFWSPFIGMGNNPINGIDPDGAFKTRFQARMYALFSGGGDIEQAIGGERKGEWFVGSQIEYKGDGAGVAYQRTFDWGNGNETIGEHAWNHPLTRLYVPDFASIGVGYSGFAGAGGGTSIDFNWVLRGPEASWKPVLTVTQTMGIGYDVDATLNMNVGNYLGDVREIRRKMLHTSIETGDVDYFIQGGPSAFGKVALNLTYSGTDTGYGIIGRGVSVGAGIPGGVASAGVSNTFILKDFK